MGRTSDCGFGALAVTGHPKVGEAASGVSVEDDPERGSQVVSHTLVQLLVVFIVLALMQLAFALHVRNLAVDAASEGARRATMADANLAAGQRRTEELLQASLGNLRRHRVRISEVEDSGMRLVRVEVDSSLPVLGPFGLPHTLKVVASSLKEVH